jgi:hypothetical protein
MLTKWFSEAKKFFFYKTQWVINDIRGIAFWIHPPQHTQKIEDELGLSYKTNSNHFVE